MTGTVFAVEAEFSKYRQLVNESNWKVSQPLLWGKHIEGPLELQLRYLTLAEDQEEERVDQSLEEPTPETTAIERYNSGPGDCAIALHLTNTLLLSAKARHELSSVLEPVGQLFSIDVEGEEFFVFNCTRVLNACVSEKCIVDYGPSSLGGQRPGQIPKLVVHESLVRDEFLFKLHWPTPPTTIKTVDYSKIPPQTEIYATQKFVDLVVEKQLTGFVFHPAGAIE